MPHSPPFHQRDPLQRFSDRAEDYARYRPTYPPEAIAIILQNLGDPLTLTAADIGAGTGISSRLLADRGVRVVALEPNAAMRAVAEPHPRVEFREGTAENTGLGDRSVDLVTCCQAFHWFDQPAALQEFHRILKPGGRLALMWNDRDASDPFVAEMDAIIRTVADREVFDGDRKSAAVLQASPLFTGFQAHGLRWQRSLNLEELQGLILSSSYVPKTETVIEQLRIDLAALFDRWATESQGITQVSLVYQVLLFVADSM